MTNILILISRNFRFLFGIHLAKINVRFVVFAKISGRAYASFWLPFASDAKLSVDDELLTIAYLLSGRFFGLFRTVCCTGCWFGLLK